MVRLIVPKLSERVKQTVVIDNRAGANGSVGATAMKQAQPDGYTLLVGSIGVFAINPALFKDLRYDPQKDFDLLSLAVRTPNVLVANPNFPASNVRELVDHLNKNPGKVTFATPGIGTTPHFTAELFKKMAGIDITHVPYRGVAAGAMSDLLTNRIDSMFNTTGSLLQAVRSGQVRGLAQSTPERSPLAPELPTFAEAGVPGFNVSSWYGLFVPAKTPPDIVKRMHDDVAKMLTEPETKNKYEVLGIEAASATADQMAALMKNEIALWTPIIKAANIKGE